ncbi:hypothetical protein JXR93_13065 [bacterium]|nr:hypothetical protein [bacterium]
MIDNIQKNLVPSENYPPKKNLNNTGTNSSTLSKIEGVSTNAENEIITINSDKGGAFVGGAFELGIDRYLEEEIKTDNYSFKSVKQLSFNISFNFLKYTEGELSDEQSQKISEIFQGEDFEELKNSFFGLNEGESGFENFSKELDDIFGKLSETLELDSKFFDGVKDLYRFAATMFVGAVEEHKTLENIPSNIKDIASKSLSTLGYLDGLSGNSNGMMEKLYQSALLKPTDSNLNEIKSFMDIPKDREEINNRVAKLLQSLSKQASIFEKF